MRQNAKSYAIARKHFDFLQVFVTLKPIMSRGGGHNKREGLTNFQN